MEQIQTVVNFVGNGGGTPEFVNSQTGDAISIVAFVVAVLCAVCAFAFARYAVPANHSKSSFSTVFSNAKLNKILAIVLGAVAAVSLVAGIVVNSSRAHAQSNDAIASASPTINAIVDESTGAVSFENGYIKSEIAEDIMYEGVELSYCEGITGLENYKWQISLDGEEVYNDVAGIPVSDVESKLVADPSSSIAVTVDPLPADVAKSLIGMKVLTLNYFVYTQGQDTAAQVVKEGSQDFVNKITDESQYSPKELLEEVKTEILGDILKASSNAYEDINKTTDPAELTKIQNAFKAKVTELTNKADKEKTKVAQEKASYDANLATTIAQKKADVAADGWLTAAQKTKFSTDYDSIAKAGKDAVDNSTSRTALDNAKSSTDANVASKQAEVKAASAKAKEDAQKAAKTEADAKKAAYEAEVDAAVAKGLWEESIPTCKAFLTDDYNTFIDAIDKASKPADIDAAKAAFNTAITTAKGKLSDQVDADSAQKKEKTDALEASIKDFSDKIDLDEDTNHYLYQANLQSAKTNLENLNSGLSVVKAKTKHSEFNTAADALTAEIAAYVTAFESAVATDKASKEGFYESINASKSTADTAINALTNASDSFKDGKKGYISAWASDAINNIKTVANDASSAEGVKDNAVEQIESIVNEATAQVAKWTYGWGWYDDENTEKWIYIADKNSSFSFDDAPAIDDDRSDDYPDLGKVENLAIATSPSIESGFSAVINEDGKLVVSTGSTVTPGVYEATLTGKFTGAQDKPAETPFTYTFTIYVKNVYLANRNSSNESIINEYNGATSVKFVTTAPESETYINVDYAKKGAIKAYKIGSADNYTVQIACPKGYPMASSADSMASLFKNFANVVSVDASDFNAVNTSEAVKLNGMFSRCTSLQTVSLNFDTSNVTSFICMFEDDNTRCENLQSITFGSNFVIRNDAVTDWMFAWCQKLEHIYVPAGTNWTAGTGSSEGMFNYNIKLHNWPDPTDPYKLETTRAQGFIGDGGFLEVAP